MDEWDADWKISCEALHCISVDVNHRILNQARVSDIKSANQFLLSYTVDEPVIAQRLFDWGVDAVFSNCPVEMRGFLGVGC